MYVWLTFEHPPVAFQFLHHYHRHQLFHQEIPGQEDNHQRIEVLQWVNKQNGWIVERFDLLKNSIFLLFLDFWERENPSWTRMDLQELAGGRGTGLRGWNSSSSSFPSSSPSAKIADAAAIEAASAAAIRCCRFRSFLDKGFSEM